MGTFTKRVAASADDGDYNAGFSPAWDYNEVGISTGKSGFPTNQDFILGVRFNAVTIPQGTTITSAKITFRSTFSDSNNVLTKIYGIDEDDTADFSSDPTGRSKTTAVTDWDLNGVTSGNDYDTADITSVVQEIINRAGWASGNDMGFLIYNDGSGNGVMHSWQAYDGSSTTAALLTIVYAGFSPSASVSPSASKSPSSSNSPSVSPSISPSSSFSPSSSPSPSPMPPANPAVLKISKPGVNVLTNSDVEKLVFSSEYGTLKYYTKQSINLTIDANAGDIAAAGEYAHNLSYYPFVEVYVSVYIGSPTGVYEYCPFFGAGATVLYTANIKLTTDKVTVYAEIDGMSTETWHFDFIIFVFKNNLNL